MLVSIPDPEQQQMRATIDAARRRIQVFELIQFVGITLGIIGTSAALALFADSPWRWMMVPLILFIGVMTYALNKVSHARSAHDIELFKLHAYLLHKQAGDQ